ncbi:putative holin-like toxin [Paenibacillus lautus]
MILSSPRREVMPMKVKDALSLMFMYGMFILAFLPT